MNILLLSMPDSFEHMPSVAIRLPNSALTSLAGNVDAHHEVSVADLILVDRKVRETVARLVREKAPDLVGLSVMTFQRRTALGLIRLVKSLAPATKIVLGGYDPSLATEAYTDSETGVDFIVRGEGELTFRDLLRAVERGDSCAGIAGLSFRHEGGEFVHNPERLPATLRSGEIRPPCRSARVLRGYTAVGRQVDVVETSRGCTFDCAFCSIVAMRGRTFHAYSLDRVLADIEDARSHGARAIFIVDDNITLNVRRFEALCRAIAERGLHKLDYYVQAMTSSIAEHGATLAPLMRRAGFRYVFLGIENIIDEDLHLLRASAKFRRRAGAGAGNATVAAIEQLHRNGMYVIGGLIVGNSGDTRESIEANLEFARRHVDFPYIQHPTPYPRTAMAKRFREDGLIVDERLEEWDGTTAVARSKHIPAEEIEYLRWRAERWMKLRHLPVALRHSPWFALRHGASMLAYTFRGSSWRSLLGLEDERLAFRRYRALRSEERIYI